MRLVVPTQFDSANFVCWYIHRAIPVSTSFHFDVLKNQIVIHKGESENDINDHLKEWHMKYSRGNTWAARSPRCIAIWGLAANLSLKRGSFKVVGTDSPDTDEMKNSMCRCVVLFWFAADMPPRTGNPARTLSWFATSRVWEDSHAGWELGMCRKRKLVRRSLRPRKFLHVYAGWRR